MARTATIVLCIVFAATTVLHALETDQFYAWGRELGDSTDVVNAKVNLEIEDVLQRINDRPSWRRMTCHQVVKSIVPRFRQFIFQDIELWAVNSSLVARIPASAEEELEFRKRYIYRNTHPLDLGTKVPPSPTVEMHGVRFGTDKLAHFFSEGWWYYKWYRKARKSGLTHELAERRAIRYGLFAERTILGSLASGVFSLGDMEANYQGMRFLVGLCDTESPGLTKTASGWTHTRPFDFRNHVTPEWDESYEPPIYGKRRWKKVRPPVLEYCDMLGDPWVVAQRRRYMERDRTTPTERLIAERVLSGKLPDAKRFALENRCRDLPTNPANSGDPAR